MALHRAPTTALAVALAALVAARPAPARAQIISPGELSRAHAELEGMRNCTRCHELRRQGVSRELCLACHEPLATRIAAGTGFHSTLAEEDCAACHKEHFGADFRMVRMDSAHFDHGRTGYDLEGRHGEAECRDCHRAGAVADPAVRAFKQSAGALGRTYLGLPTGCVDCHGATDPHSGQFEGRRCEECHDPGGWEGARGFDHDRARYRPLGLHRWAACSGCHPPLAGGAGPGAGGTARAEAVPERGDGGSPGAGPALRYRPLDFAACTSCHEDEHRGAMRGACDDCHSVRGWLPVSPGNVEGRFDHAITGFLLEGAHREVACASCHDEARQAALVGILIRFVAGTEARAFPHPETGACASCHMEPHDGVFLDAPGGGACTSCHGQEAWLPADYDLARHDREARFALDGAHAAVPCASCHGDPSGAMVFALGLPSCADCHRNGDPHGEQFRGRECDECHSVERFAIPDFDHGRTAWPLDGAHAGAPCSACHTREAMAGGVPAVRYRPLGTRCVDCHGGGS
jgi:hypothetical protein